MVLVGLAAVLSAMRYVAVNGMLAPARAWKQQQWAQKNMNKT